MNKCLATIDAHFFVAGSVGRAKPSVSKSKKWFEGVRKVKTMRDDGMQ